MWAIAFDIELNAIACQRGSTIAQVREVVARRNEIAHWLGVSLAELRGKLGEPAASLAKFNRPLEQAFAGGRTTAGGGLQTSPCDGPTGAIQHYQRATRLDPDFGLAYAAFGPPMTHRLSSIWRPQMKRRPLNVESAWWLCRWGARSARATGVEAERPCAEV
jgi:hypothetical protein